MEELNKIKKQFDELMAKAEEIIKKNEKDEEPKWWRAEKEETYWHVDSCLEADWDYDSGLDTDHNRWKAGNYFKTEEEAKKVAQHFRDYLILRADAKGYEPKSLHNSYFYVYWSAVDKRLKAINDSGCLSGTIYFESREDAEASIKKHRDVWKRYLGADK